MKFRHVLVVLALILVPAIVQAQDCTNPNPSSIQAATVGENVKYGACFQVNDTSGNPVNATGVRWYKVVNGADQLVDTTPPSGLAPSAGMLYAEHVFSESQPGTFVYKVALVNSAGEAPAVPFPSLVWSRPQAPPAPAERLRIFR